MTHIKNKYKSLFLYILLNQFSVQYGSQVSYKSTSEYSTSNVVEQPFKSTYAYGLQIPVLGYRIFSTLMILGSIVNICNIIYNIFSSKDIFFTDSNLIDTNTGYDFTVLIKTQSTDMLGAIFGIIISILTACSIGISDCFFKMRWNKKIEHILKYSIIASLIFVITLIINCAISNEGNLQIREYFVENVNKPIIIQELVSDCWYCAITGSDANMATWNMVQASLFNIQYNIPNTVIKEASSGFLHITLHLLWLMCMLIGFIGSWLFKQMNINFRANHPDSMNLMFKDSLFKSIV